MCVSILSTTSVRNVSHSKKNPTRYDKKKYIGLHVYHPLFLSDFNGTWIFWPHFRKILKYQISWKSAQQEPWCSMRTDGQTDITKPTVTFSNSVNAPKKCGYLRKSSHRKTGRISNNISVTQTTRSQITEDQVIVGFMVNRVALEHFFSQVLRFSPLMPHTHTSTTDDLSP